MTFKTVLAAIVIIYINFALYLAGYSILSFTVIDDFEQAENDTYYLKEKFKEVWHKRQNRDAYEIQQREVVESLTQMKKNMPDNLSEQLLEKAVMQRNTNSKLVIEHFEYLSNEPFEFYSIHEVHLRLVGSYRDIVAYLHELEAGGGIILLVFDFSMSVQQDDKVRFDGILHTYQYRDDPETVATYEKWFREYKDDDQAH